MHKFLIAHMKQNVCQFYVICNPGYGYCLVNRLVLKELMGVVKDPEAWEGMIRGREVKEIGVVPGQECQYF